MTAVRPRHHIAALAYPGMAPFELAIVIEVFGLERPELDVPSWYTVEVCGVEPGGARGHECFFGGRHERPGTADEGLPARVVPDQAAECDGGRIPLPVMDEPHP